MIREAEFRAGRSDRRGGAGEGGLNAASQEWSQKLARICKDKGIFADFG